MPGAQSDVKARAVRGRALVEGRHHVSPFNFVPEVTSQFEIPTPLELIDSTIRKVIYTLGVRPTDSDLLAICDILEELGIREECLNIWWGAPGEPNEPELNAVRVIARSRPSFRINVFTDTLLGNGTVPMDKMRGTVDMLAAEGIKILNPGLLQAPDDDARKRQIDDLHTMADYVAAAGMTWNATIANCARRDFDALVALTNACIEAGVRRLDLMDSTSTLSPQAMMYFMRTYRSRLSAPTPITMHTHDDFGMATASTIAAVLAGASPDVALNGVSYRSGFAALEEVVLALDVLYGVDTGINLSRLQWAADRLAEIMDFPIPPLKPVVGSHQNMREAPYQIARMLAGDSDGDFGTMSSSVAPSVTGSKYRWVWATQHSDEIVRMVAAKLGVALSPAEVAETSRRLETRVAAQKTYPKWATEEDVTGAIRAVARTG